MKRTPNPHGIHKMNIIAVEDDPLTANAIKQILENRKCHVDIFATGEDLLKKISLDYDLVLLDLELPGIDGIAVANTIRHRGDGIASIPIVALTSHEENEQVQQARAVGINGFLIKPLSPNKCNLLLNEFRCKH